MYYSVCKPIEPAPVCEPVRDAVDINVLRDVNKPVTTNVETEKSEKQASKEQEEKTKTNTEEIEKLKEKRSSEIYRGFQLARQKSVEEANKEGKSIVQAWLEQGETTMQFENVLIFPMMCVWTGLYWRCFQYLNQCFFFAYLTFHCTSTCI